MDDLLRFSTDLPEVEFDAGDVIMAEGSPSSSVWVLVSGGLSISKGGAEVTTVTRPGSVIGEISVLLESAPTATVTASVPSRLREAEDGRAFLFSNDEITRVVAVGLAARLNFVTSYLADLKQQYGDAPGLSMVPAVLRRLAERQAPAAISGSSRDPQPEY
jgi:CRP/FNR family transcriptional regulator, cyclic AMP receptor protein